MATSLADVARKTNLDNLRSLSEEALVLDPRVAVENGRVMEEHTHLGVSVLELDLGDEAAKCILCQRVLRDIEFDLHRTFVDVWEPPVNMQTMGLLREVNVNRPPEEWQSAGVAMFASIAYAENPFEVFWVSCVQLLPISDRRSIPVRMDIRIAVAD